MSSLVRFEHRTRIKGPLIILLALLALASPLLTRGRERTCAVFLLLFAAVLVIVPPATLYYDARLAVPAFGPLAASAAVGLAAAVRAVVARRRRRRTQAA